MNYPFFIARRLSSGAHKSFSQLIIRIAIASVAISIAVMIISLAIVTGFQKEIRDKVIGFGSHIQIAHLDLNNSYETAPMYKRQAFKHELRKIPGVRHVQTFATKAGIIKTKSDIEAIVLKGVGSDFDWSFFREKLQRGHLFRSNEQEAVNEVIISKYTADKLKLDTGQSLVIYFIQEPVRVRKFTIAGIYDSGLEDYDKLYMLCDIGHIRKLNDWGREMTGGFEVLLDNFDHIDEITDEVNNLIGYQYEANSIKELNPNMFEWLNLLDVNVQLIMFLMMLVSVINMITAILVLILERTNMIGTLKAFGAGNARIGHIFIYLAGKLIFRGLLLGNILALSLCYLQQQLGLIRLDQRTYYMSRVPVTLPWQELLLLNGCAFLICLFCMYLPVLLISRINPIKAIRYD